MSSGWPTVWTTACASSTRRPIRPCLSRTIDLRVQPRWLTFSIDGRYAYLSTGDVMDVRTKKIVGALEDELGAPVRSERLVEIDFAAGRPATAGRQVGIGGRR